jgi:DNA repair protein RecN (Recombination protein N)
LADDAAERLRDAGEDLNFSPEELDELESRLDTLYRLKKKYGSTVSDMLHYLDRCRKELDQIQFADDTIAHLEKQQETLRKDASEKAAALSEARKTAAELLEHRVQEELSQLDMPKVRFRTEFSAKAGEWGLDETGQDEVQFLMSANVGEALKPIQKVASGGELARIMLALKNVLAEDDGIGSLVFDEVDTGVSGRAAQKVAEKMSQVARHKQVLCVTHLPQIAAMADTHFSVEKGERNGRTFTRVNRLEQLARQQELARLIGGTAMTDAILRSAEELLGQAVSYKDAARKTK